MLRTQVPVLGRALLEVQGRENLLRPAVGKGCRLPCGGGPQGVSRWDQAAIGCEWPDRIRRGNDQRQGRVGDGWVWGGALAVMTRMPRFREAAHMP